MYRIIRISHNVTIYDYGQYGYFTDFVWYAMSSDKNLNIKEFVRTD